MSAPFWRSVLRGVRGADPLPGSLCDETPAPAEPAEVLAAEPAPPAAGKWRDLPDKELIAPSDAASTAITAEVDEEHDEKARLRAELLAARKLGRISETEVDDLRRELVECTRELEDECRINEALTKANTALRGRVDALQTTVRHLMAPTAAAGPGPHDHGGDLLTPWRPPHDRT